jgi:peroxin-14
MLSFAYHKFLEKIKESQAQRLEELQQELKSLKSLMLNRRPASPLDSISVGGAPVFPAGSDTSSTQPMSSSTISAAFSNTTGTGIPNWQRGGDNDGGTGKIYGAGNGGVSATIKSTAEESVGLEKTDNTLAS